MKKYSYLLLCLCLFVSFACTKQSPKTIESLKTSPVLQLEGEASSPGHADLHVHMFGEYSFGGMWFQGSAFAQSEAEIYKKCVKETGLLESLWNVIKDPYLKAALKYGECLNPDGSDRASWDNIGHAQVWSTDLKKAHSDGLTLMIVSMANNETLCKVFSFIRTPKHGCDDMEIVNMQIDAFKRFQQKNQEWIELARSADDARDIIKRGKLAVILGIEVSNTFGAEDWKIALNRYYERGVRTIIPTHLYDNRFGGAALQSKALYIGNFLKNFRINFEPLIFHTDLHDWENIYASRTIRQNERGLTKEGREFLSEMMDREMLIDLAHMSSVMMKEVIELAKLKRSPVFVSHGHFREVMQAPRGEYEKSTPYELAADIRDLGGIFGLRTSHEPTNQYAGSGVDNNCQGSSKSFAQAYTWGVKEVGVPVAFGSDLNGFIPLTRPRFGREDCQGEQDPTGTDFDEFGLGKISSLRPMLSDLKTLGVDTRVLEHSTEYFLRHWEKRLVPKSSLSEM